ncbi:hypothetical protein GCM10022237_41140 [Nocardioides ginsengisoli]|uniref:Uncharacterized protein n=1 Tax=Nocardioides ginsengisoli TaxID=363868 RepID=A0ABW3W4H1_9ACTN
MTTGAGHDPWLELRATIAGARAALDRVRAVPTTTPEERRELQRVARSGELGPRMRELAEHVEAGETSWPEVFEGISPYTDLLRDHLDAMVALHGESVRQQLEADPTFDPTAPHEDV